MTKRTFIKNTIVFLVIGALCYVLFSLSSVSHKALPTVDHEKCVQLLARTSKPVNDVSVPLYNLMVLLKDVKDNGVRDNKTDSIDIYFNAIRAEVAMGIAGIDTLEEVNKHLNIKMASIEELQEIDDLVKKITPFVIKKYTHGSGTDESNDDRQMDFDFDKMQKSGSSLQRAYRAFRKEYNISEDELKKYYAD